MTRPRLGREISALLAAKLILLCALYFAFFDAAHKVTAGATEVSARLLSGTGY